MGTLRRGLRAELASIFDVDPYTLEERSRDPRPPTEATSAHLCTIIDRSLEHVEDARTVYHFLPVLMLRLFGFTAGLGWLETVAEYPHRDRDAILRLLLPGGPVHRFCDVHSPQRSAPLHIQTDMRFEFPRAGLPSVTDSALRDGAVHAITKSVRKGQSFLAPFLVSALRDPADDVVYLSPLDYLYVCMVASPTRKWTQPPGLKRQRRSTSLPSRRALYNQLIAAYAGTLNATARVDLGSIFLATCLDYWFLPWATARPHLERPLASASTADAVLTLLLTWAPSHPDHLDRSVVYEPGCIPEVVEWRAQTHTSLVYRAAETMLQGILAHYDPLEYYSPLVIYLRALALWMAPWKASQREALRQALFPKVRAAESAATATAARRSGGGSMAAALTSRLQSINALASPTGSPGNCTEVKEAQWRAALKGRQRAVDEELVRLVVMKAAEMKLARELDGSRALGHVADAITSAKVGGGRGGGAGGRDEDVADQLRNSLSALRTYKVEGETKRGKRERNYLGALAAGVGVRVENTGVLGGISEIVGMSGGTVAGVVNMVSGSAGGGAPGGRSRLTERRLSFLQGGLRKDVPFLGGVWDLPISDSENEFVVLWLYRLALSLEPRLGFVPDIRFLGRYWILFLSSVFFCTAYVVRGLLKNI